MTEHVAITGLDVTVNAWSNVFDFTPVDGETKQRNWTLLEPEDLLENFMSSFELLHCKKLASSISLCLIHLKLFVSLVQNGDVSN